LEGWKDFIEDLRVWGVCSDCDETQPECHEDTGMEFALLHVQGELAFKIRKQLCSVRVTTFQQVFGIFWYTLAGWA